MADEKPNSGKQKAASKSGGTSKAKAKPKPASKGAAKKSTKAKAKPKKAASKKASKSSSSSSSKSSTTKSSGTKSGSKTSSSKSSSSKSSSSKSSGGGRSSRSASGLDKSIAQFRDSLEQNVTLSLDRLQEVVDDTVTRGRMTRGDSEKMIGELVARGRKQTDTLLGELEKFARAARRKLP